MKDKMKSFARTFCNGRSNGRNNFDSFGTKFDLLVAKSDLINKYSVSIVLHKWFDENK